MTPLLDETIGLPEEKLPQSKLCSFAEDFAALCKRYGVEPRSFVVWVLFASVDVQLAKKQRKGKRNG